MTARLEISKNEFIKMLKKGQKTKIIIHSVTVTVEEIKKSSDNEDTI